VNGTIGTEDADIDAPRHGTSALAAAKWWLLYCYLSISHTLKKPGKTRLHQFLGEMEDGDCRIQVR
jgi:hypothetical protein